MRAYLSALVYNGLDPFTEIDEAFCRVYLNVFPNAIFLGFDKVMNNLKHHHRSGVCSVDLSKQLKKILIFIINDGNLDYSTWQLHSFSSVIPEHANDGMLILWTYHFLSLLSTLFSIHSWFFSMEIITTTSQSWFF